MRKHLICLTTITISLILILIIGCGNHDTSSDSHYSKGQFSVVGATIGVVPGGSNIIQVTFSMKVTSGSITNPNSDANMPYIFLENGIFSGGEMSNIRPIPIQKIEAGTGNANNQINIYPFPHSLESGSACILNINQNVTDSTGKYPLGKNYTHTFSASNDTGYYPRLIDQSGAAQSTISNGDLFKITVGFTQNGTNFIPVNLSTVFSKFSLVETAGLNKGTVYSGSDLLIAPFSASFSNNQFQNIQPYSYQTSGSQVSSFVSILLNNSKHNSHLKPLDANAKYILNVGDGIDLGISGAPGLCATPMHLGYNTGSNDLQIDPTKTDVISKDNHKSTKKLEIYNLVNNKVSTIFPDIKIPFNHPVGFVKSGSPITLIYTTDQGSKLKTVSIPIKVKGSGNILEIYPQKLLESTNANNGSHYSVNISGWTVDSGYSLIQPDVLSGYSLNPYFMYKIGTDPLKPSIGYKLNYYIDHDIVVNFTTNNVNSPEFFDSGSGPQHLPDQFVRSIITPDGKPIIFAVHANAPNGTTRTWDNWDIYEKTDGKWQIYVSSSKNNFKDISINTDFFPNVNMVFTKDNKLYVAYTTNSSKEGIVFFECSKQEGTNSPQIKKYIIDVGNEGKSPKICITKNHVYLAYNKSNGKIDESNNSYGVNVVVFSGSNTSSGALVPPLKKYDATTKEPMVGSGEAISFPGEVYLPPYDSYNEYYEGKDFNNRWQNRVYYTGYSSGGVFFQDEMKIPDGKCEVESIKSYDIANYNNSPLVLYPFDGTLKSLLTHKNLLVGPWDIPLTIQVSDRYTSLQINSFYLRKAITVNNLKNNQMVFDSDMEQMDMEVKMPNLYLLKFIHLILYSGKKYVVFDKANSESNPVVSTDAIGLYCFGNPNNNLVKSIFKNPNINRLDIGTTSGSYLNLLVDTGTIIIKKVSLLDGTSKDYQSLNFGSSNNTFSITNATSEGDFFYTYSEGHIGEIKETDLSKAY